MLRNLDQGERDGERSDYMGQHLGGLVGPLPVTPWGDRSLLSFHSYIYEIAVPVDIATRE